MAGLQEGAPASGCRCRGLTPGLPPGAALCGERVLWLLGRKAVGLFMTDGGRGAIAAPAPGIGREEGLTLSLLSSL